jgi:hypothetical protein
VRRHEIIHVHVCKRTERERADHSTVEKAKHRQDMTSSRVTGSSNNIWFLTLSKEAYFNSLDFGTAFCMAVCLKLALH